MGKKPLSENHVKSLRKLVADNPLHSLLLNLSVDLMLRSSDLLSLKVSDLLHESGKVKTDVKVKTKKTGKTTLSLPLSKIPLMRSRDTWKSLTWTNMSLEETRVTTRTVRSLRNTMPGS